MTVSIELRRTSGALLLCVGALIATLAAAATQPITCSADEISFDIPAMPLPDAVVHFGRATGLPLSLGNRIKDVDVSTRPLVGCHSPEAALTVLLSPLGLTFSKKNDRAIYIFPADDAPTHPDKDVQPDANAELIEGAVGPIDAKPLETIVVEARPPSLDASITTRITREDIAAISATTLPELLQHISQRVYTQPVSTRIDGAQYAELRGLEPATALVLVNGRRMAPNATDPALAAFDLNAIPLLFVEQIEVSTLPSVTQGMDAIGGIIDIELARDISQPQLDVSYGGSRGGGGERQIAIAAGHRDDRFGGSFALAVLDRERLPGEERERWRDQDYRRFGGRDMRTSSSNPGNVRSPFGRNLPGLAAPFASIPAHVTTGPARISDFQLTAGQRDLESLLSFYSIMPATERLSLFASADAQIGQQCVASVEAFYSGRETRVSLPPAILSGMLVDASNPYNPFGEPVVIDRLLVDLPPRQWVSDAELGRAIVGIRGVARGWNWEIALLTSEDHGRMRFENDIDLSRTAAALSTSDPQRAMNIFGAGPVADSEILAAIRDEPSHRGYRSAVRQVDLSARGPLADLPAGTATGTFGTQLREEEIGAREPMSALDARRRVSALFGELRLPLVKQGQLRGIGELSLVTGARLEDYGSGLGWSVNPLLDVIWHPATAWTVHAAHRRSFLPPSLRDLYNPRFSLVQVMLDPRRGDVSPVTVITGGNSDLQASAAHSSRIGVTFTPPALDTLRVDISYWRIRMKDVIQQVPPQVLLANADHNPERVVRQPAQAGLPGQLAFIDVTPGNFGTLDLSGIDLQASHDLETSAGHLTSELSATWIGDFRAVDYPGARPIRRVGVASPRGTVTKWQVGASLKLQRGAVTLSSSARYSSSYEDATGWNEPSGRTVPARTVLDALASLDLEKILGERPLTRGLTIAAGAVNLLDTSPAYSEVGAFQGYDPSQGDLRGRFVYLRISKEL